MQTIKKIFSWIFPIVLGVGIALVILNFFKLAKVDGPSMEPNLQNNERVFLCKKSKIHHNSVIIFDAYGEDPNATTHIDYVKRVIGMPGDTVSSKNGVIYVNGHKINQNYIDNFQRNKGTGNWDLVKLSHEHDWSRAVRVPAGHYFVLGDHRSVSNDSRYWGFVKKSKVLGVVKVPFWSGSKQSRYNINDAYKYWKN